MYLFTDREGTYCPKRPHWGENRIKSNIYVEIYESNSFWNARCSSTEATVSGKQFLHAKTFLSSAGSPGLIKQLN